MTSNESMLRASLAGAVDLSALKKRALDATGAEVGATPGAITEVTEESGQGNFEVASLVTELTTANLRSFMAISNSVPVIVEFYTNRSEHSRDLSAKLAKLIREAVDLLIAHHHFSRIEPDYTRDIDEFLAKNRDLLKSLFR